MNPIFGVRLNKHDLKLLKELSTRLERTRGDTLRYLLIEAHSNLRKEEDNGKITNNNYQAAAER